LLYAQARGNTNRPDDKKKPMFTGLQKTPTPPGRISDGEENPGKGKAKQRIQISLRAVAAKRSGGKKRRIKLNRN